MTDDLTPGAQDRAVAPSAGAPVRAMALGLWVVVGALLTYGIAQTVLKASALFG